MYSFVKVKYFNSAFSIRAVNGTKKVVCILFPLYFTASGGVISTHTELLDLKGVIKFEACF
jgi:hypothetical protein